MKAFEPTPEWLDQRFQSRVVPRLFAHPPSSSKPPIAVLLGGQPGAGKTRATQVVQDLYDDDLVVICGDDFRVLHPDYKRLQRDDPVGMPDATAKVSGPMVERCIQYAQEHGFSIVIEGTFRSAQTSVSTAQSLAAAGYRVHAVALAVPPMVSRMSALARFYETLDLGENRWTPLTAHELAVAYMHDTVMALGQCSAVARLTLVDRDGVVLFDGDASDEDRAFDAKQRVVREHARTLNGSEQRQVRRTYEASAQAARANPVARAIADDEGVHHAWALVQRDQASLNPEPGQTRINPEPGQT